MKRKTAEANTTNSDHVADLKKRAAEKYGALLDEYQMQAFNDFLDGRNCFWTGAGGCGKTFLLNCMQEFHAETSSRQLAITSMTGVTALMVGGKTFSSFFGFGVREGSGEEMWREIGTKKYLRTRFRRLNVLIIDEVSMLSAQMLDAASFVASRFRQDWRPFGGIQVVLCGDFSQLPPVKGRYAFHAQVWREMNLAICELRGNHRQASDETYRQVLEKVRAGTVDEFVCTTLRSRLGAKIDAVEENFDPVELCSRRNEAQKINDMRLDALAASEEFVYEAELEWVKKGSLSGGALTVFENAIKKNSVTPASLRLRRNAQVMLTKNIDLENGLANGSTGVVIGFETQTGNSYPIVRFNERGTVRTIRPQTWLTEDRLERAACNFKQIPLILAYAITVHKIQGATLDYVSGRLDRSCFCDGMAYVLLSRVRALNGLTLKAFSPLAIKTNNDVLQFYRDNSLLNN